MRNPSRLILALLLLPTVISGKAVSILGRSPDDVPVLEISEAIKSLAVESDRLRREISTLPEPGEIQQMDAYGYHGGYLPVLTEIPVEPRWTLDVVFPGGVNIEKLILVPAVDRRFDRTNSYGFPKRFRISKVLTDGSTEEIRKWIFADCPDLGRTPQTIVIPGEPATKFRIEVFRGGIEGERELFALDEIFGIGNDEIQKAGSVAASSEFESLPYWSRQFLIDQKTSLGLPVGVPHPASNEMPDKDFSVDFDSAPPQPCVVELDLGRNRELGWVTLYPANPSEGVSIPGFGFPKYITVDLVREKPDGGREGPKRLYQKWDGGNPGQNTVKIAGESTRARWVRINMNNLPVHGGKSTFAMGEILLRKAGTVLKVQGVRLENFPKSTDAEKNLLVDLHSAGVPVVPFLDWVDQIELRAELEGELAQVVVADRELKGRWNRFWLRAGFFTAAFILIAALLALYFVILQRRRQSKELRQRITSDLHDDIGSWMSAIGLSTTHLRKLSPDPKVLDRCGRIDWIVGQMQSSFQDVLWFTNSDTDSLRQMVERLRFLARQCVPEELLHVECDPLESIPDRKLGVMFKRDLMLVFKEALGNAAKHSEATEIRVSIIWDGSSLNIAISDDGKGFDYSVERQRQRQRPHLGLNSMERRAKRLGGILAIDSSPGNGSVCSFRAVP